MKILLGLVFACGAMCASARPLVVQESARITNPDPAFSPYFANDVAVDGDDAIATLDRYIDSPTGDPMDSEHDVAVWLFRRGEIPAKIYKLNINTGQRVPWKEVAPPDSAGVYSIVEFVMTPDAKAYAYSYTRLLSELYLVKGLK